MSRLLPALVLLGVLADPAGTSTTCPVCSLPGQCTGLLCPPDRGSCLLSHRQLENRTIIQNGTCVAPQDCRGGSYSLTFGPSSSLSFSCCKTNCLRTAPPEAEPNGRQCHYCPGSLSGACDTFSVLNCTGKETSCVQLAGSWHGGTPQILMGCGTPEVCGQRAVATLQTSGFQLTSAPECRPAAFSTPPASSEIMMPLEAPSIKLMTSEETLGQETHSTTETHNTTGSHATTKTHITPESHATTKTHITPESHATTKSHITPESHATTKSHITPESHATTKSHITPESHATTKTHITPESHATTKSHITPESHATTKSHITPESHATTKTHITPESHATTKSHITPESHATTKTHITPESHATTKSHITPESRATTKSHITPESHATTKSHDEMTSTTCFTCASPDHCENQSCPLDKSYHCLQVSAVFATPNSTKAWRNGFCVATEDCHFLSSHISSFTFGSGSGVWINTTCCQGHCPEPPLPEKLPISHQQSKFLCPWCMKDSPGSCDSSLYLRCPHGESSCVQLDLESRGVRNISVSGCGTHDLCSTLEKMQDPRLLGNLWLSQGLGRVQCDDHRPMVMDSSGNSGTTPGLCLTLSTLLVALGVALS